jgi:hypothetical protein
MTGTVLRRPPDRRRCPIPHGPSYQCPECWHQLRARGSGRTRIFSEIDADELNEPVMDPARPQRRRPLPSKARGGDES